MKAIISQKSGSPDVLEYREVEIPIPKDRELIIKIHASTVTRGDVVLRKMPRIILAPLGLLFGFKAKNIPGTEFSGEVEQTGSNVSRFRAGDHVVGTTTGLKHGGNAEYVCIPEKWKQGVVERKPPSLSFEEAAAMPVGSMTALYLLKKAGIENGQKVLVYGASGSVGTFAVQIAKFFGTEVTGVCSTKNTELVRSLGADFIIDYIKDDFTAGSVSYDLIFDAVGKISKSTVSNILTANGSFISVKSPTHEDTEALSFLLDLAEKGILKPVIDKTYPLEQTAEAHRYVEGGHKKGNVAILVS